MPTLRRVEFSTRASYKSGRLVLLVEIPEAVLRQIAAQKMSPQAKAYEVALKAAEAEHLYDSAARIALLSNTPGKVKDRDAIGHPSYTAEDGCCAWIVKKT